MFLDLEVVMVEIWSSEENVTFWVVCQDHKHMHLLLSQANHVAIAVYSTADPIGATW